MSTTGSEWTRCRIIDGPIPSPLPTITQILTSQEILSESIGRRIVGVGQHFVAKFGPTVTATEADVLAWLEQSTTTIRTPKLYAVFKTIHPDTRQESVCLVTERIHGNCLKDAWHDARFDQKDRFAELLRKFFQKLRALPQPEFSTPYCNPMGGPLLDEMFLSRESDDGGPYRTEEDLIMALICRSRTKANMPRDYVDGLELRLKRAMIRGARPIFTHGHLRLEHIFVVPAPESGDGKIIDLVLIDWEFAGWYVKVLLSRSRLLINQVPGLVGVCPGHAKC
jgi:hypothetical protein